MFLLLLLGLNIFGAASQRVTNKVFFDMTIGGQPAGRIVFGLFGDVVPKTVANFVGLAKDRTDSLEYKGTQFFRIIPGFMAQGGDNKRDNGSGGESIYGEKFNDENFDIKLTKKYQLAMANAGPNTNGAQFFISLANLNWLSGKHVVFGEVIEGKSVVNEIEKVGTWGSGKPSRKVVIADCGELPMGEVAIASESGEDMSGSDSAEAGTQEAVGKPMMNPYYMKAGTQEAVGKPMMDPYYMKGEAAVGMERFGEGLKPDGDCLVSRYSKQGKTWGKYHPINSRYGWQECDVQPVGAYCEEAWDCEQYKCVNKKCVASGMDWDEETYHWDERTWDERSKGSEGMRGSEADTQEAVGKTMMNPYYMKADTQEAVGKTMMNPYYMKAAAQETEALAYTAKRHADSPLSLVNLFAAFGFAMTVYGAFRHYVK